MKALSVSSPTRKPAKRDHSAPSSTSMAARKSAICSSVMMPAWLSLWPAKGSPKPLMVYAMKQ